MLEELYEDRWSAADKTEAGVSDVLGVIGDLELPMAGGDDKVRVSSVNGGLLKPLLASFLEDDGRRKNIDFHECELGLCGVDGACIVALVGCAVVWGFNGETESIHKNVYERYTETIEGTARCGKREWDAVSKNK